MEVRTTEKVCFILIAALFLKGNVYFKDRFVLFVLFTEFFSMLTCITEKRMSGI